MAVPELGWGWGCPLLPRLPLKTYYLHCGLGQSLFPIRVWTGLTFGDEMESCWTDCILFSRRFEEKNLGKTFLPLLPWG